MSSERPEEFSQPPVSIGRQTTDDRRDSETADSHRPSDDTARHEATVLVRGETIRDQEPLATPKAQEESLRKEVSQAKVKMQSCLPVLDDDSSVGVQKEQIVIRDGKPDLVVTDYSGDLNFLIGLGTGSFQPVSTIQAHEGTSFVIADFNGDGAPDIAIVDPNGQSWTVWLNACP